MNFQKERWLDKFIDLKILFQVFESFRCYSLRVLWMIRLWLKMFVRARSYRLIEIQAMTTINFHQLPSISKCSGFSEKSVWNPSKVQCTRKVVNIHVSYVPAVSWHTTYDLIPIASKPFSTSCHAFALSRHKTCVINKTFLPRTIFPSDFLLSPHCRLTEISQLSV